LEATFTGTATLTTTNALAAGPFASPLQLGLRLDGLRTYIVVTSFPPITTAPIDTPLGQDITTITKGDGGFGGYTNGNISVEITLHFDHSLRLAGDSDLTVILRTLPPGSPVAADGAVTLAGSGTFQHGFLGGATGTLVIAGTITPVP
jgi:hypothetical protein